MIQKKILQIVGLSLIIKLIAGLTLPIVGDEAYYWIWGQHLQLSYLDHPGMVAWISSLTSFIPGIPAWASLRILFILLSVFSFYVWLQVFVTQRKFDPSSSSFKKPLYLFTLFFMLNPLLGIGSVLVTPDAPLLLFWGLSAWATLKILEKQRNLDYINLGIFLGLGFCSKYHIVLFPLVTLISLYLSKKLKELSFKKLLLTVATGLIFCSPVLIWNFQNDFISFRFQLNHGLSSDDPYRLWWTTSYLFGQVFIFNPILLFSMLRRFKQTLFNTSSVVQWLFFLYSSFKAKVEANWPITSHTSGLIDFDYDQTGLVRAGLIYFLIAWIAFPFYVASDFGQKKLTELPSSLTIQDLRPTLEKYKPLYGPTYQISALLSLMTETSVPKLRGLSRYDFYDFLGESFPSFATKFYTLKYEATTWPEGFGQCLKTKVEDFKKYHLELFELNCQAYE